MRIDVAASEFANEDRGYLLNFESVFVINFVPITNILGYFYF